MLKTRTIMIRNYEAIMRTVSALIGDLVQCLDRRVTGRGVRSCYVSWSKEEVRSEHGFNKIRKAQTYLPHMSALKRLGAISILLLEALSMKHRR